MSEKNCGKCPHNPCPYWVDRDAGMVETNIATGEERFIEGCFFQVMPKLMIHVIRASNRPAASMDKIANELVKGFTRLDHRVKELGVDSRPAISYERKN